MIIDPPDEHGLRFVLQDLYSDITKPPSQNPLRFTIPGKVTSANMNKTPFARRAVKTERAREDAARIKSIVFAAVKTSGWKMPDRAAVYIVACNSRLDCGNIEKIPVDALKGLAIVDDNPKHLRELHVRHADPDKLGERYEIRVESR